MILLDHGGACPYRMELFKSLSYINHKREAKGLPFMIGLLTDDKSEHVECP